MDSGAYFNASADTGHATGGFLHIDRDVVAIHPAGTPCTFYRLEEGKGLSIMAAFNLYFTSNVLHVRRPRCRLRLL